MPLQDDVMHRQPCIFFCHQINDNPLMGVNQMFMLVFECVDIQADPAKDKMIYPIEPGTAVLIQITPPPRYSVEVSIHIDHPLTVENCLPFTPICLEAEFKTLCIRGEFLQAFNPNDFTRIVNTIIEKYDSVKDGLA